jgi:hypothetical protein
MGLTVTERRRMLTIANLKQMTENRLRPEKAYFKNENRAAIKNSKKKNNHVNRYDNGFVKTIPKS